MACPQHPEIPLRFFTGANHERIKAARLTLEEANDQLRYLLNELRAIDGGEEHPTDQQWVVKRLRKLADHIESGGVCPDANAIVSEAAHRPIQV